jgi:hypothetical protein
MKKIILLATGVFMSLCQLNAQDNYTIKMSVKTEGMPDEYAAYGEQEITTWLKGEKSKMELSSMMFSSINYSDGKTITSLSESMGNKNGFTATKEEMETIDGKEKEGEKPKIEYLTEKKTIAGYECTKAIIISINKDKTEDKMIVWFTDKIKSAALDAKKGKKGMFDFGDLKGFALCVEANKKFGGMEMKLIMTATEVRTTPIDDSVFKPVTDGYTMKSYKEYKESMRAMQGGR